MKLIEGLLLLVSTLLVIVCIICIFHIAIENILEDADKQIKQNDKNTKNKN